MKKIIKPRNNNSVFADQAHKYENAAISTTKEQQYGGILFIVPRNLWVPCLFNPKL